MPKRITVPVGGNIDGRSREARDAKDAQRLERLRQALRRQQQAQAQPSEYERTLAARRQMFQAETGRRGAQPQAFGERRISPDELIGPGQLRPAEAAGMVSPLQATQRLATGVPAMIGGAFLPEYYKPFAGKAVETAQRLIPGQQDIERRVQEKIATGMRPSQAIGEVTEEGLGLPSTRVPLLSLLPGMGVKAPGPRIQLGVQGAVEALAPVPFAGPVARAAGAVAAPVVKAAAPIIRRGVQATGRAGERYVGRAIETGGVSAGIPGPARVTAARAAKEDTKELARIARDLRKSKADLAKVQASGDKSRTEMIQREIDQLLQERDEIKVGGEVAAPGYGRIGELLRERRAARQVPPAEVARAQAEMPVAAAKPVAEARAGVSVSDLDPRMRGRWYTEDSKVALGVAELHKGRVFYIDVPESQLRQLQRLEDPSEFIVTDAFLSQRKDAGPWFDNLEGLPPVPKGYRRIFRGEGAITERISRQAAKPVAEAVAEPAPGLPIPGVRRATEPVTPRAAEPVAAGAPPVEIPIESVRRIERTIQQAEEVYGSRLRQFRAEYEQATAAARADFEMVDRPAYEAYQKALAQGIPEPQARALYMAAIDPAYKKLQETLVPAQAAWNKSVGAIGKAFDQGRARIKPDIEAVEEAVKELRPGAEWPIRGAKAAAEPVAAGAPPTKPPSGVIRLTGLPPPRRPVPPVAEAAGAIPPEGFAANIRLSKYPEDIRPLIKGWADVNPEAVQVARRGVRSDAQVLQDAKELVNDLGGRFDRIVAHWKPGQAWNAEEVTALRGAVADATRGIVDAQAAIRKGVDTTENQLRLLEAVERRAQLQAAVHGITAEAGRSLRAYREMAQEGLQSRDVTRMAAILKELEGKAKVSEIVKALEGIDLDNPAQVSALIRAFNRPRWWAYPLEVMINGYLSGPTTHAINTLSNAGMVAISPARRALAATIEAGMAPLQGRARQRFFAEVPADVIGAIQGIPEGTRSFLYTMRYGAAPSAAAKYELPRVQAFTGKLGAVVNQPSRLMQAADQLFYHINYRAAMNAEAVRMARTSPKVGMGSIERTAEILTNPTTEMIGRARLIAERNLFRNDPGSFVKSIMGLREIGPGEVPVGRFLVPFARTPANLLTTGLRHSPAGLASPSLWKALAGKSPEFSDRVAEVVLGTGVASALALYFANGHITGAAPENQAERDKFYREGKLPYAIKIGNTWIQYRRLEPFNTPLNLIAAVIEATDAGNDKEALDRAGQAIASIGRNFLDQPYMTGVANVLEAIEDPTGFGRSFLERFALGFIPYSSALRQTAQMRDDLYRRPVGLTERFEAQIPGLTGRVPERLTAFGEAAQRTSPAGIPIAWSEVREDEVEAELTRLRINIGFVGKTIGGKELTREQQHQYQELAGQMAYQALDTLLANPDYATVSDVSKERAINRAVDNARERARRSVLHNYEPRE